MEHQQEQGLGGGYVVTLLYVEDDTATLDIVSKMILRKFPTLRVITAQNGEEGLRLFAENRPDIVLTDISMPVMSGIDMARCIKEANRDVPIIAATALSDTRLLLEAIRIGISRYVLKPIEYKLLFEGIEECIARVTLERQIREQHAFIRKLSRAVEQNPSMVIIANADGVIEYANPKFAAVSGYLPEEIIGRDLCFLFSGSAAEDDFDTIWSTITGGSEWHGEVLNRRKDGSTYYGELSVSASRDDDGSLRHFIVVMQDISGSKKLEKALQDSEKQFRTLCDLAPIGIFRADNEGNNLYCNPRWEEITGLSGSDGLGKGWLSVIHPEDRQRHTQVWCEAMSSGSPFSLEYRQLNRNGTTAWVRALVTPIRDAQERTIGLVGTLEDVTELQRARQEMLKAQKLESLGLLAGGIAHDFNNLLTGILGNIALARHQLQSPDEAGARLQNAEQATARARELTHQLLTFARGGEPIKKVITLAPLLHEAAGFALHGSNVRPRFGIDDALWPVEADEGQLAQVIHNLVINAVQAMPEGGTVSITADNVLQNGESWVRITVADTGVGIPEHHLPKIFDPYFTTKQRGSGLGLATCYSIIRKHNGTISVNSTLGKGSSFDIVLPAAQREAEPAAKQESRYHPGSGYVLLMDDEKELRDVSKAMLEQLGYTVECAESGAEAIDLFTLRRREGAPFALVILDLTIPGGIGGKETITRLREIDPGVKAIVSSGYSNDPVMANYRAYGFAAVLTKPYTLEEMNEALHALFQ